MTEKILAIDDHEDVLTLIRTTLQAEGYEVHTARNGEEGLRLLRQIAPDLVILDIMMPGVDGWEVCDRMRETSSIPIIILTALKTEQDVVQGLVGGADDYLVKPFRMKELRARVAALLRRVRMPRERLNVLRFRDGDLVINRSEQAVFVRGEEVPLSPVEYNLLLFMAERAGLILSTRQLIDSVWGSSANRGAQSVKWHIWRLRQKIEADPRRPCFILTERGKGYRFSAH